MDQQSVNLASLELATHIILDPNRLDNGDLATIKIQSAVPSVVGVGRTLCLMELDLTEEQAAERCEGAFEREFPDATRCGAMRRMYAEAPGQAARQRVWVATAVNKLGPVQICLGPGGTVLRADSVG